jgi:hypothetical protein
VGSWIPKRKRREEVSLNGLLFLTGAIHMVYISHSAASWATWGTVKGIVLKMPWFLASNSPGRRLHSHIASS